MTEPTPSEGQPPATGYLVPPGHGGPYVLPYAPAPKTNGLAVASLVTSIVLLNFCFPATIIGAIMGHVARRRIRETGEDGEGLALGGIVVGWIGFGITVAAVVFVIILAASGAFDGPSRPDIVY